jgi:hypothetical protein
MNKTISITPQVMLALVGGATLRAVNVPAARGGKIVKSGYDAARQEFWVEVSSDSFENPEIRLPQTFILDVQ